MAKSPVKATSKPKGVTAFLKTAMPTSKIISGRTEFYKFNEPKCWVPSGIYPLDLALSNGRGIPTGVIILASAEASVGKTLLGLHLARAFQNYHKNPGFVHFIETEGCTNAEWVESQGVDVSPEMFVQFKPTHLEELFEYIDRSARYHHKEEPTRPIFYFVDSVTACPTKRMTESKYTELTKQKGSEAQVISPCTKKLEAAIQRTNSTVFMISQLRDRISINPMQPIIGDPKAITGGNTLPFYNSAHIRLKEVGGGALQHDDDVKKKDRVYEQMGKEVEFYIYKTRFGPPFRKAFVPLIFEESSTSPVGFDTVWSELNWLADRGHVTHYTGADKALIKAGANQIILPSGVHVFLGTPEWRKLYLKKEFVQEVRHFMHEHRSSFGNRAEEEEGKKADEEVTKATKKPKASNKVTPAAQAAEDKEDAEKHEEELKQAVSDLDSLRDAFPDLSETEPEAPVEPPEEDVLIEE